MSTRTRQAAEHEPIARVLPMLSVPHLDREFDYLVAAEQSDDAQPGVRVRVRFHGRLVDAFVLERRSETDHVGEAGLARPCRLRRAGAHRRGAPAGRRGRRALRGNPGRRAASGRPAAARQRRAGNRRRAAALEPNPVDTTAWAEYGRGEQYLSALADGRAARAVWQALPGERWADRLAEAAAVTVNSGRGVLAIVPDQRDVDALHDAGVGHVDESGGGAVGRSGPAQRYRRWLAVLRGGARWSSVPAARCSRPSRTSVW